MRSWTDMVRGSEAVLTMWFLTLLSVGEGLSECVCGGGGGGGCGDAL